ncbi:nuclear factor 7, ovary-like [Amia ocellicauda]|uniref:nuclear factor 7, ovary-like n=1 Tax=Amia ocellicauda TaxID=2972642 RepID=UPI003463C8A6
MERDSWRSQLQVELSCKVCQQLINDPVTLECGHGFCRLCLSQPTGAQEGTRCPDCDHLSSPDSCRPDRLLQRIVEVYVQENITAESMLGLPECSVHGERLKLFCRGCFQWLCVKCLSSGQHVGHKIIPTEETLDVFNNEVQDKADKYIKALRSLETSSLHLQDQAHTRRTRLLALFNSLYLHLGLTEQALRLGVRHQRSLLRADLEGKARLAEAAKWSLMKEVQRVEELAAVKDLFLMNNIVKACKRSPNNTVGVQEKQIHSANYVGIALHSTWKKLQSALLLLFSEPLTFDPNTAHPNLLVSEDGRTVEHTAVRQEVPDNPERYNTCLCVLAAQGFISGRHYWEVEVGEKIHWDLGVARESVIRKGNISLGPSSGYWAIMLRDGSKYSTCTSQTLPIEVVRWPSKIGILLDYEKGSLSFYNTANGSWLFSFSDTFNERLYPYFHFGPNDDGRNSLALRICPPQATMEE